VKHLMMRKRSISTVVLECISLNKKIVDVSNQVFMLTNANEI
jgi:hypothetical protein